MDFISKSNFVQVEFIRFEEDYEIILTRSTYIDGVCEWKVHRNVPMGTGWVIPI